MAVLKKHHRAARYGHYYECLVKFKGVAYNKVRMCMCRGKSVLTALNVDNINRMVFVFKIPSLKNFRLVWTCISCSARIIHRRSKNKNYDRQ